MTGTRERIDIFDPRGYARGLPHEAYRRLRAENPVAWQEEHAVGEWPAGPGFWAVTRYDDVVHVLRSPNEYSSWVGATQIRDPDPEDLPFIRQMMLNMDPPAHRRLRQIVAGAFTPRRIERFAARAAARARALVDGVAERGECDLPVELTDDYPVQNLADLLGIPPEDRELIREWTDRGIGYQDPDHAEVVRDSSGRPVNPRSPARLADMFEYAHRLAARKRRDPDDDLMTALATAPLTDGELSMFFFLLVIAGNDPMRFDITRRPGDHVSFGDGPHLCLGAHFARLQLRAFYAELLWRPPDLEPVAEPTRLVSNFIAGIKHLPVRFTPTHRTGDVR